MYDFSCIYLEFVLNSLFFGVGGLLILIASRFWNHNKRHIGKMVAGLLLVGFCIFLSVSNYIPACINPKISIFRGAYVESDKPSKFDVMTEHHFFSKDGEKGGKGFTLDIISKKKIYPSEFKKGKVYRIYYEERTNIIVKVED